MYQMLKKWCMLSLRGKLGEHSRSVWVVRTKAELFLPLECSPTSLGRRVPSHIYIFFGGGGSVRSTVKILTPFQTRNSNFIYYFRPGRDNIVSHSRSPAKAMPIFRIIRQPFYLSSVKIGWKLYPKGRHTPLWSFERSIISSQLSNASIKDSIRRTVYQPKVTVRNHWLSGSF